MILVAAALAETAVERRLYADRVDASSFLWNDWNRFQENYHPNYAVDGDPATAWVEGDDENGAGEWIRVPVSPLAGTTAVRLKLMNGYQKSASLYKANARMKEVEVRLLPSGVTQRVTLKDAEGWQEIRVAQQAGELRGVEVRVVSAYAGTKYLDLCLSELEVYATAETRDNPAAEKAKLDRLLAWKRERVAAAAAFKEAKGMPLATRYALEAAGAVPADAVPECEGLHCQALGALTALRAWSTAPRKGPPNPPARDAAITLATQAWQTGFAGWKPVQAVAKDTREVPPVEGVQRATLWDCFEGPPIWVDAEAGEAYGAVELPLAPHLGFLRAEQVGTFALNDAPSIEAVLDARAAGCKSEDGKTYAWALTEGGNGQPERLRALFLAGCGLVELREGNTKVGRGQILVYGADGGLELLAGDTFATAFAWRAGAEGPVLAEAWRVGRWFGGAYAHEADGVAANP